MRVEHAALRRRRPARSTRTAPAWTAAPRSRPTGARRADGVESCDTAGRTTHRARAAWSRTGSTHAAPEALLKRAARPGRDGLVARRVPEQARCALRAGVGGGRGRAAAASIAAVAIARRMHGTLALHGYRQRRMVRQRSAMQRVPRARPRARRARARGRPSGRRGAEPERRRLALEVEVAAEDARLAGGPVRGRLGRRGRRRPARGGRGAPARGGSSPRVPSSSRTPCATRRSGRRRSAHDPVLADRAAAHEDRVAPAALRT